jgi:hypothetical protein
VDRRAKEFTHLHGGGETGPQGILLPKSGEPQYIFQVTDYRLDCWSFIPGEEYDVYAALFHGRLSGIPSGRVELEKNTTPKQLQGNKIKVDRYLAADFNSKNKVSLTLENAFPDDGPSKIRIRDDREMRIVRAQGGPSCLAWVSRGMGPVRWCTWTTSRGRGREQRTTSSCKERGHVGDHRLLSRGCPLDPASFHRSDGPLSSRQIGNFLCFLV